MPPARFLETTPNKMEKRSENESGISKPKLKVLHWDKVKANTNRAMVWDQLKSNSFQKIVSSARQKEEEKRKREEEEEAEARREKEEEEKARREEEVECSPAPAPVGVGEDEGTILVSSKTFGNTLTFIWLFTAE
ncbi:hypothetical protein LguiB_034891 [Lonicera macranthoides]